MTNIQAELAAAFSKAIAAAFGPEAADADPQVKWAADARHGDLQANFAMGLGKRLGKAGGDAGTLSDYAGHRIVES